MMAGAVVIQCSPNAQNVKGEEIGVGVQLSRGDRQPPRSHGEREKSWYTLNKSLGGQTGACGGRLNR